MPKRTVTGVMIVLMFLIAALAGCSRKVVRSDAPQPSPGVPYGSGPIAEQSLQQMQALQAQLHVIYFDYDQYTLTPQAQTDLLANAEILKRVPHVAVVAEGHCDERGTAEYNLALGDRRARAVVEFLVNAGLAPERFSTVSYGSELPVDPGHNEAAWAKNRRVYLRVSP